MTEITKANIKERIKKLVRTNRLIFTFLLASGVFYFIFSKREFSDIIVISLLVCWWATVVGWNLKASHSFAMATGFLLIGQMSAIFQKVPLDSVTPTEKAVLWAFFFLVSGVIIRGKELWNISEDEFVIEETIGFWGGGDQGEIPGQGIRKNSIFPISFGKKQLYNLLNPSNIFFGIRYLFSLFFKKKRKEALDRAVFWLGEIKKSIEKTLYGWRENSTIKLLVRRTLRIIKLGKETRSSSISLLKNIYFFMKKEISFYRNNRKELFNQVKRKLMQEVGEILKQFLPILDMWRGGIKAINQLIPIYKISFFLVNFVLGTPFLHLLIFFLILKKLEKEIRFYQNFFGEQHKASFSRMAGEKLIVYFIVLVFICLVFVVIREKFAERLFFRQKEKKNFESLARNSLLYFFGLRSNVFDRGDFVGKTGGGRQRKLLFLVLFLFIFFLIEKRVFFVARDKFEFYPYIHNVFVDIASSWQEFNVYGFNFRDLPFKGKVLVNGKEIRVLVWSDKLIVAEADPANPSSGDLEIVNDYGFGKGIYSNKVRFNYFDSRNASAEEEKKFWSALKEKARRKSGEIGADDWK